MSPKFDNTTIDISKNYLMVTFIDVGWGDSIYIETKNDEGDISRALIDSNDSVESNSSYTFLKRFFEKNGFKITENKPFFDFIILSHDHLDHAKGLKNIMRKFGTRKFWYSKSSSLTNLAALMDYCNRVHIPHHSIDTSKGIPNLGNLSFEIIWPEKDNIASNENNNSVVLKLSFFDVLLYLTGDAESEVWDSIAPDLDNNAVLFKVPHHGSSNGTFDFKGTTTWFDNCKSAALVISSHIRPFGHPDSNVTDLFDFNHCDYYRTDLHHHVTFLTDGIDSQIIYSH